MRRVMILVGVLLLLLAPMSSAEPPQDGAWTASPIAAGDEGLYGYFASLAFDTAGEPMVLFNDEDALDVKMAMPGPVGWAVTTATDETGYYCRLLADGSGVLHGAFVSLEGNMRYGTYDGAWDWQTVGSLGDGVYLDMALDSAGNPYLASINGVSGMLRCAWYDGATWHDDPIAQVGIDNQHFRELAIALDGDDVPHISAPYEPGGATCSLLYATIGTQGWGHQIVDTAGERGKSSAIIVDGDGTVHITYRDSDENDLRHAWFDGAWHKALLDGAGDLGYHSSLALDDDGCVNVAYYDREADRLRYAWLDGGTWRKQTLNTVGACRDALTSLVFDDAGQPHMMAVQGATGGSRQLNHVYFDATFSVMLPLVMR